MIKFFVLTSALLLAISGLLAQSHYQPGLVVTDKGDTLRGYIDNQQWRVNPQKIKFRKQEGGTTQVFGLQDLRYFSVDGQDAYLRAFVKEDMNPMDGDYFTPQSPDSTISGTVFLKVLVIGNRLSLYGLTDSKVHFYISTQQNEYKELVYKRYLIQSDGNPDRIDEVAGYRNQLSMFISGPDSVALTRDLEKLAYSEGPLGKKVLAINGQGNAIAHNPHALAKGILISGYGAAGVSVSSLSFSGAASPGVIDMAFNHPLSPSLEVGVDFQARQNWGDLTLRASVSYWSASFAGHGTQPQETNTYQLKVNAISPGLDLLYSFFRSQHLRIYAGGGVSLSFCSYPTNMYAVNEGYSQYTDPNAVVPESSWLSLHFRVGVKISNHLGAEIEGMPSARMTDYMEYRDRTSNYSGKVLFYF